MTNTPDIVITNVKKTVTMVWILIIEETLLEALVEMVCTGKRAESGFKKEAWNFCVTRVKSVMDNNSLKAYLDAKKCKSKTNTSKLQWQEFVYLMNKSG